MFNRIATQSRLMICLLGMQFALAGCLTNEPIDEETATDESPFNNAPVITGTPPPMVKVGVNYMFRPTASDQDADTLTFTIRNAPGWTAFSRTSGELSGMPFLGDEGTYADIRIEVSDGKSVVAMPAFTITVEPDSASNLPPNISGNGAASVTVGNPYSFSPTASDPDGDNLSFTIMNRPSWLAFNSTTGRISGTPQAGDIGTYQNISITVSDGQLASSTPAFSITVNQIALGQVTLSWTAPTQNTDGTPLNDLSGYRIYYGTQQGNYPNRVVLNTAGLTSYVVDNLSPGTWFFVSTAVNATGMESDYSNVATKMVN